MLVISNKVAIPENEVQLSAVRSAGPGGQNVNKVATAVHLRFDVPASSLPDYYKARLLRLRDARISKDGVVVIKADRFRSQNQNKEDALARLAELVRSVKTAPPPRIATRPTRASQQKRLDRKTKRGLLKESRRKVL